MSDFITILRCAGSLRLAKTIRRDLSIINYDSTRTFDGWSIPLAGIEDINLLLRRIINNPRLCAVRGELMTAPARNIRRLVYADQETGDAPTLRDVPRQWLALDVEGVEGPFSFDVSDLTACGEHCRRKLGAAFRSAACVVQATAGHRIKTDLRLRIWFWLTRPITTLEAKLWFEYQPIVDSSTLRPAQIIYTAAPIFESGADHLPERLVMLPGDSAVLAPDPEAFAARRPPAVPPPLPAAEDKRAPAYAWAALRNAAAAVSGAPVNSRHPTCVTQARSLARLVQAGLLTAQTVTDTLSAALVAAGKTQDEGVAIVAWALRHPTGAPLPEGVAR
jgi:hypothetical protein